MPLLLGEEVAVCCLVPLLFTQLVVQVFDTAWKVGRFSVSTTSDVPFKEMANHCEALMMGKQQKMSVFANTQQKHYILDVGSLEDQYGMQKYSCSEIDQVGKVLKYIGFISHQFASKKIMMMTTTIYHVILSFNFSSKIFFDNANVVYLLVFFQNVDSATRRILAFSLLLLL